jgi:hypothetical protein
VLKILFTKQDDLLNTNQFLNKPKLLEQIRITIICLFTMKNYFLNPAIKRGIARIFLLLLNHENNVAEKK